MYWLFFFLAFLASIIFTLFFGQLMSKIGIVDKPKTETRKIHKTRIPYGGGLAIFFSFFIIISLQSLRSRNLSLALLFLLFSKQ